MYSGSEGCSLSVSAAEAEAASADGRMLGGPGEQPASGESRASGRAQLPLATGSGAGDVQSLPCAGRVLPRAVSNRGAEQILPGH